MQIPEQFPLNGKSNPEVMTVADVARRLKTSPGFIYGAIGDGRLKHYRLGKGQGAIRISEQQLQEFLGRNEEGGSAVPSPPPRRPPLKHLA